MANTDINHKELLEKYMRHVFDCSSCKTYLELMNEPFHQVRFTNEETEELKKIVEGWGLGVKVDKS